MSELLQCSQKEKLAKAYGIDILSIALYSDDYGWEIDESFDKKYVLLDVPSYEGKITIMSLVAAWQGTGHSEWEYCLAAWLIYHIMDAQQNGVEEADITSLFNRDLLANRDRRFSKERIYGHIMPFFRIDREDGNCTYLRLIA